MPPSPLPLHSHPPAVIATVIDTLEFDTLQDLRRIGYSEELGYEDKCAAMFAIAGQAELIERLKQAHQTSVRRQEAKQKEV